MTPEQFLEQLRKKEPAPAYVFLGSEPYQRDRCRKALLDAALPAEDRESGFSRHDLDESSLAAAIDDARSFSLFASRRIVWVAAAESALPRGRGTTDEEGTASNSPAELLAYLQQPTPATVLVIESSRYDFESEDKPKLERVQKFFSSIEAQVEFRAFSPEAARAMAQSLAKQTGLQIGLAELAVLLEVTGGNVARIAVEIEKLRVFAGADRKVTLDDLAQLVPDAQSTTIFALVAALGRGDRARALQLLDTLSRAGEYMPLALTFLGTQFRLALTAREAGLKSSSQILAHFNKLGARIWPERARQIEQTVQAFPQEQLEHALVKLFETDRALRDARPDDRIVMEEMILALTAK